MVCGDVPVQGYALAQGTRDMEAMLLMLRIFNEIHRNRWKNCKCIPKREVILRTRTEIVRMCERKKSSSVRSVKVRHSESYRNGIISRSGRRSSISCPKLKGWNDDDGSIKVVSVYVHAATVQTQLKSGANKRRKFGRRRTKKSHELPPKFSWDRCR